MFPHPRGIAARCPRPARVLVAALATFAAGALQAQTTIPLVSFHSAAHNDFFTTSDPAWTCRLDDSCTSGWVNPDYALHAMQGHVYNPALPQPVGTLPLWHWFSEVRGDNFTTADPAWNPAAGTFRSEGGANYTYIRLVGYIKPTGTNPHLNLTTFWNGVEGDNATLATAKMVASGGGSSIPVRVPAGYSRVRTDGTLLPPPSATLDRCLRGYLQTLSSAAFPAYGNLITPSPGMDRRSVVKRLTAPNDLYRIDYWGTQKAVRGDSTLARVPFPAPGVRQYALLARVTTGRVYVADQGWSEANQWFRALGELSTVQGACALYEGANGAPGDIELSFNDSNVSDNGGWANVTIRQWWD